MRDIALTPSSILESEGETPRLNRRQAAKVRTRQKVLDAARTLFAERGYEPATIRDIARGAGMSTGAVFANFQDKAELFEAVLAEDLAKLAETLRAAAAAETSVRARLLAALGAGPAQSSNSWSWSSRTFSRRACAKASCARMPMCACSAS